MPLSLSVCEVIEQLNPELRNAVAILYILVGALETIQSDGAMEIPVEKKAVLLSLVGKSLSQDRNYWDLSGLEADVTKDSRVVVVAELDKVINEFRLLKAEYQTVILEVVQGIIVRMADSLNTENGQVQSTTDIKSSLNDGSKYGYSLMTSELVSEGLTRLAIIPKFANAVLSEHPQVHHSVGLFLQETSNILVFQKNIKSGKGEIDPLQFSGTSADGDIVQPSSSTDKAAKPTITTLTVHALAYVEHVLAYLDNIVEPSLLRLCALQQVLAVAMLELVFGNSVSGAASSGGELPLLRRPGLLAKLSLECQTRIGVYTTFKDQVHKIHLHNKRQLALSSSSPSSSLSKPNPSSELDSRCHNLTHFITAHCPRETPFEQKTPDELMVYSQQAAMNIVMYGAGIVILVLLLVWGAYFQGVDFNLSLRDVLEKRLNNDEF